MKHRLCIIVGCASIIAVQGLVWALDNEVPIQILRTYPAQISTSGGLANLKADVKRDLKRRCSLKLNRKLFTPQGRYVDLKDSDELTALQIETINKRSPDRLEVAVLLPAGLAPGRYDVVTNLMYSCNPLQQLFPIESNSVLPVDVIAPEDR